MLKMLFRAAVMNLSMCPEWERNHVSKREHLRQSPWQYGSVDSGNTNKMCDHRFVTISCCTAVSVEKVDKSSYLALRVMPVCFCLCPCPVSTLILVSSYTSQLTLTLKGLLAVNGVAANHIFGYSLQIRMNNQISEIWYILPKYRRLLLNWCEIDSFFGLSSSGPWQVCVSASHSWWSLWAMWPSL